MHIVAISDLTDDKQDRAEALAAALRVTAFEALSRLRAPGAGPFIVGVFAEQEQARGLAGQLASGGFNSVVLKEDEIAAEAGQWSVRRFVFKEQDLYVESAYGESRTLGYQEIDLMLRGIGISSSTAIETTKQRKLDLGAAVLSGGLKMTKTTKTTREVTTEERQGFVNLYAGDGPVFAFRETSLIYDTLGPARGLSRSANFVQLVAEMRRRCPAARYDDRLLNKAGAAALLGPTLSPEAHLVVATALLAKALRRRS